MFDAVVYDLETLGTEPGHQILSIGAWELDTGTGAIGESFFCLLGDVEYDPDGHPFIPEQAGYGLVSDLKCITEFWDRPEQAEARKFWEDPTADAQRGFDGGLHAFAEWLGHCNLKGGFWSRGFFDANLLGHAYISAGLPKPWPYWAESDARTLLTTMQSLYPGFGMNFPEPIGVKHHALDDAYNEAVLVGAAIRFARDCIERATSPGYPELAMRTAAGPEVFHYPNGDKQGQMAVYESAETKASFQDWTSVDRSFIHDCVDYLSAAQRLDIWKSRLFYGKDKMPENFTIYLSGERSLDFIRNPQLIHGILGVASEGAEMVEDLLKLMAGGLNLANGDPRENLVREQGDVDWFQELIATAIDVPVETSRTENIKRLRKRFPGKFSETDAVARADEDPLVKMARLDEELGLPDISADEAAEIVNQVRAEVVHTRSEAIVVIHGPMASGKTHNAEALLKYYRLERVVELDDRPWRGGNGYVQPGDLVLTNLTPERIAKDKRLRDHSYEVVSIEEALRELGGHGLTLKDELYMTRLENGTE